MWLSLEAENGGDEFVNMSLVRRVRAEIGAREGTHSELHFSDGDVLTVAHPFNEIEQFIREEEKALAKLTKTAAPIR